MPCTNHSSTEGPLWQCSRCSRPFCMDCIVQIGGQTYCADCKAEAMRDIRSGVSTSLLELASIGRRFAALFIDNLIVFIPMMILFLAVGLPLGLFTQNEEQVTWLVIGLQMVLGLGMLVVWILYEGLMLSRGGQTLGKKWLGLKVVTPEGNDITRGQAFSRAAIRQVLYMFCFLVDYLPALGQDRTCVHDMAAKTRVVTWRA